MFKDKRYQEIAGIFLILLAAILLLSLLSFNAIDYTNQGKNFITNRIGIAGSIISYYLRLTFGISSYLFFIFLSLVGYKLIRIITQNILETAFIFLFLIIASSSLITLISSETLFFSGGLTGYYINKFLKLLLGSAGSYLFIIIVNLIGLILAGIVSISGTLNYLISKKNIIKKTVKAFVDFFSKKFKKRLPYNTIDDDLNYSDMKLPWITKKRIRLHNKNSQNMNKKILQLNYLQAPVNAPVITGENLSGINNIQIDEPLNIINDEITIESYKINSEAIQIYEIDEPENIIDVIDQSCYYNNNFIDAEKSHKDISIKNSIIIEELSDTIALKDNGLSKIKTAVPVDDIPINSEYIIPVDFLNSTKHIDSENWKIEIKKNSELLVNTLADFGIESRVINVNRGPVITLYEIQIAPGIKVNRIVGLADDIAMALAALRVRIVAPIPGKSAIGVEIPNKERENVTLGDVIKSKEYQKQTGYLKVGLGKDILGNPITLDIRRLPHLLIAGATGSGKSVCVNSIISSLMYNYNPHYLRFILIDPKMVELQIYNGSPHLLTPVITESTKAQVALKWIMFEMDRRYRILSEKNCRDIEKYNQIIKNYDEYEDTLPYIITIIDELADLMMSSTKDMESYVTRIAQKARAVGIHLVLATQRPSVDVITGVIKANFPARIAFQVAQKTDSRTILDQNGAEKLLGMGDMLYQSPMCSFPVRIQGSYVSEDEILKIVNYLRTICRTNYIDIESYIQEEEELNVAADECDELFNEAIKIIEETRKASASYLQRRLSIGYNRAAKIIEQMEEKGYIGPQHGSKAREIYI